MKKLIALILFLSLNCPAEEILILGLGEIQRIAWKPTGPLQISQSKLLGLKRDNQSLIVSGKAIGSTLIKDEAKTLNILVVSPLEVLSAHCLLEKLQYLPHLAKSTLSGKIVITGFSKEISDWSSLSSCKSRNWLWQAHQNDELKIQIQKSILRRLYETSESKTQKIEILGSGLQATVSNSFIEEHPEFAEQLEQQGVYIKETSTVLNMTPNIRVKIWITEIKKNSLYNLGIQTPNSFTEKSFSPEFALQLLEKQGQGKVLANPSLLARNGEAAQFFAGGEFPIQKKTSRTSEVIWRKFGIDLKVKSIVDSQGKVRVDLDTSISNLNGIDSESGIPNLTNTTLSSKFDVNDQKVILLSGLINSNQLESSSGLPWISQIPILGTLFSSKEFINSQSELVIFFKPEVIYE